MKKMKARKLTKPTLVGDTYLIVNHNAEVLNDALEELDDVLKRVSELEKRFAKEDADEKTLENEGLDHMTTKERGKVIGLVKTAFAVWESRESDVNGEDDWSEEHKARDAAVKALRQKLVLGKVRAEIERQEEWLSQAGYSVYNIDIAFSAIKRVIAESE